MWSFSFAQQYTNYSTKDGLPSNHVYTTVQDTKGYMWFLTDKGMVKYNGKSFKTYTTKEGLPNNDVWDAFTTPDGKIWYLSKSTHLGYIKNDSILSFPNEEKNEIINPIFSYHINDSVYLGGSKKIFRLKNNTWKNVKSSNNNTQDLSIVFNSKVKYIGSVDKNKSIILFDENKKILKKTAVNSDNYLNVNRGQITDSLFFWTSKKAYSILNLNTLELKSMSFKNEIGFESIRFSRINLVDNQLQISGEHFVGLLDKDFHITKPFFFPKHLNAHFGFIDKQNTIWLSTFTNGVYKIPAIKQDIKFSFNDEKILNLDKVKDNLFLSIYNKGYYKYNTSTKNFNSYIKLKDFSFGATNIKTLNTTFFLNDFHLVKEQNNKREIITFYENRKGNKINGFIKKIAYFNSELYGINSFGIYKLDDSNLNIKKDLILRGCNDIINYKNRLIIATNNGLKELKNDTIIDLIFEESVLRKSILSLNKINDSKLLINTDGYGSYITDLKTITPLKGSEFLIVQDAFIKDTSIWLATNTGVLHFKNESNIYKLVRNYTINDGLPNNDVNTIFVNDKDLIIGTNNGLAILPINQKKQDLLIDVFIEKAIYNGQIITEKNNTFNNQNNTNNTLNIEVDAINFSESTNNNFYYKLDPIQTKWTKTTTKHITFNNLQPNKYVFQLKSNDIKKQLKFSIKPLWWQNTLAGILIGLFAIVITAFVVWKLSEKVEAKKNASLIQEKKLTEIQLKALRSQMNPHFVFNSLAAIQYYINNNEIEASEAYLVKFSKLIRQFFELSKETEISLEQEIALIKNYLDIEKLRFKDKFEYKINIDTKLKTNQYKLPTMLLQPIVENAVNHGIFNKLENGNITINFSSENSKHIKVEIIDDGVGFVNTKKKTKRKIKSSNVLEDRLRFLNQTGLWNISYTEEELHPKLDDKGNKSTFIITNINYE
ncbi:sensor histidine kinase [Tenacibaculum aquimarinum]|uniref:sensor histidine kinase n=1 Tax=Tenacibaculum aquimarinum TaxID=2910675 RepID=UPI001F0B38DD|nr:histidine kinase [Tenacibaculum aquimarinum]MCH3884920.1 histidine kinase [Tenacibaculum aquimarinum]